MWRFLVVLLVCCRVGFASSPVRIYNDTQVTTNGNWGLMNTSEQYATYSSRGSPVINWSLSPGQESWYYDNYGSGYGAMAWLGNDWNFGWEGANWGQTILVSELGVVSPPTNNYCYACVSGINEDTFLTVRATAIGTRLGFLLGIMGRGCCVHASRFLFASQIRIWRVVRSVLRFRLIAPGLILPLISQQIQRQRI